MPEFLPDRLEAGTHNVCGIAGLLEGVRYVLKMGTKQILAHEQKLLLDAARKLSEISGVECFQSGDLQNQAGVLSVRLKGRDCEELGEALGERGIAVRAGLHCAPLAHQTAGTLETGTVRISFSAYNTRPEVQCLAETFRRISPNKN